MECIVSFDRSWVRLNVSGVMTHEDLSRIAAEGARIEAESPATPHRLTDLSGLERLDLKFADVMELVQKRKAGQYRNPFKSAIVATTAEQHGFARMFQTLNDHPQITVAVFSDVAAAEAWLAEQ